MHLLCVLYNTNIHKCSREIQTVTLLYSREYYYLRACNPPIIRPKITTEVKAFQRLMFVGYLGKAKRYDQVLAKSIPHSRLNSNWTHRVRP